MIPAISCVPAVGPLHFITLVAASASDLWLHPDECKRPGSSPSPDPLRTPPYLARSGLCDENRKGNVIESQRCCDSLSFARCDLDHLTDSGILVRRCVLDSVRERQNGPGVALQGTR